MLRAPATMPKIGSNPSRYRVGELMFESQTSYLKHNMPTKFLELSPE